MGRLEGVSWVVGSRDAACPSLVVDHVHTRCGLSPSVRGCSWGSFSFNDKAGEFERIGESELASKPVPSQVNSTFGIPSEDLPPPSKRLYGNSKPFPVVAWIVTLL